MRKLKSICGIFVVLFSITGLTYCKSSKGLPCDPQVYCGQLNNGMRFFVRKNSYDKQRASLRLVVKAGSSIERDNQRGLAHFIEHMIFRGTENFSDGEVIKFLESIGASFGADTNAYTAFDETVYHFDFPLDARDSLEKALSILADFSSRALFPEDLLEKEKKVVLDELRLRLNNCHGRFTEKVFAQNFEGTRYANRLPGGLPQVIQNSTRDDLLEFYKTWYRPDNMALIAVGDFDQEEVVEKIRTIFSPLKQSEKKAAYPKDSLPIHENRSLVYYDKEAISSYMQLSALFEHKAVKNSQDIKSDLFQSILIGVMNKRFQELSQEEHSPFKFAVLGNSCSLRDFESLTMDLMPWETKEKTALLTVLRELKTITQYGLTQNEFDEKIVNLKTTFKTLLENQDKQKNPSYIEDIIDHYLNQDLLMSVHDKTHLYLSTLDSLTLGEINDFIKAQNYQDLKWSISLLTPSESCETNEQELISVLSEEGVSLETPAHERKKKAFEVEPQSVLGTIVNAKKYPDSQIEELELSNGLKIYVERSDLKKNLITFSLYADGGYNCIMEDEINSAVVSTAYASRSGLARLTQTEIQSALAGKNAEVNFSISLNERSIYGTSSNEDLETAFKLVYAFFHERYFRDSAWNQILDMYKEYLKTKDKNPDVRFFDTIYKLKHSNHYLFNDPVLEKMDKNRSQEILNKMFSDPSKFKMIIVGDFDRDLLEKNIIKYLSNILPQKESLEVVFDSFEFPKGITEEIVDGGLGEKAKSSITLPLKLEKVEESKENYRKLYMIAHIISQRLRDKIRMDHGDTYSINCDLSAPFFPKMNSACFEINFSCDPYSLDRILDAVKSELIAISDHEISEEELNTVKEIYKQNLRTNEKNFSGILKRIKNLILFNEDLSLKPDLESEIADVKQEDLNRLLKTLIDLQNYICVSQKTCS